MAQVRVKSGGSLTAERLRELVHYDPETGIFTRRTRAAQRVRVGDVAGSPDGHGYLAFNLDGKKYMAHRVAWFWVTGEWPDEIDHINGIRHDNHFLNLRPVTRSQNIMNSKRPSSGSSGFKGVGWHKRIGKFASTITVDQRRIHLGYFDTAEDAHEMYCEAAVAHFGEYARFW